MHQKINVFHVEDYKIMRDGVKQLLQLDGEINVVGEAKNAEELFRALTELEIDVVVLDLFLDAMEVLGSVNGFQICRTLGERYPSVRIVVHTAYDDADRVAMSLKAGALGFVSKKAGYEELTEAIKAVHAGKRYICHQTSRKLKNLNTFLLGFEETLRGRSEIFSKREREILTLLAAGKSSKVIAEQLFITERTVETHRKHMLEKMDAKNMAELIANASGLGLVKK
jgi:DNA-binding NarL/FixJ family response regulator